MEEIIIDDIWMSAILNLKGARLSKIIFNDSLTKFSFVYADLSEELLDLQEQLELSRGEMEIRCFDLRDEVRRLSTLTKKKKYQLQNGRN